MGVKQSPGSVQEGERAPCPGPGRRPGTAAYFDPAFAPDAELPGGFSHNRMIHQERRYGRVRDARLLARQQWGSPGNSRARISVVAAPRAASNRPRRDIHRRMAWRLKAWRKVRQ